MGNEGMKRNGSTFASMLQATRTLEDVVMGSLLHTLVEKFSFKDDACVQTSLLGMYSNCGDFESAKKVFGQMSDKDAVAWNSMIYGDLKNDKIKEGQDLFVAMVRSGVNPTKFTYSMMLNACSRSGDLSCGKLIHAHIVVLGVLTDLPLQNAMLDMYCNCGDTETAFSVFSRMENPYLISWNSMIAGCVENEDADVAMALFVQLLGLSLLRPDEYTFAAILSATSAFLASDWCGKPLHAKVIKVEFETSVFVGTTLVSMYLKNKDSESAQCVNSFLRSAISS